MERLADDSEEKGRKKKVRGQKIKKKKERTEKLADERGERD